MSIVSDIWLTDEEAAAVLSEVNGRPISKAYVRVLAKRNHIRKVKPQGQAAFYYREDCARCVKPYRGIPKGGRPRNRLS